MRIDSLMTEIPASDVARTASGVALMLGWLTIAVIYAVRPRGRSAGEKWRDPSSITGIAIESVGFALVWGARSSHGLFGAPTAIRAALTALVFALVAASTWMAGAAVRTLGKQWSITARVLNDHQLVV